MWGWIGRLPQCRAYSLNHSVEHKSLNMDTLSCNNNNNNNNNNLFPQYSTMGHKDKDIYTEGQNSMHILICSTLCTSGVVTCHIVHVVFNKVLT